MYRLTGFAARTFWDTDTDVGTVLSCGPFVIDEYVERQRVVLTRNVLYAGRDAAAQPLPYLDKVTIVFVENSATELARFLNGEIDFLELRSTDHTIFTREKLNELNASIYDTGPSSISQFLVFNQNPAASGEGEAQVPGTIRPEVFHWTSNREFRPAMAHVIDRETMIRDLAQGFGYPQYSFIPRISPYCWEGAEGAAAKYDPGKAREILDNLGWVDSNGDGWREDDLGNTIVFELTTNAGNMIRESIGRMFAEDAASVGVQVQFEPEDFNTMVGKLLTGQGWDAIIIGLTGSIDPVSGSNVYPSNGNLHMVNPNQAAPGTAWEKAADDAWGFANNTADEQQRKEGFEIVQRIWLGENPWIFTFNVSELVGVSDLFGNVYPHPVNGLDWVGILPRLYIRE